MRTVTRDRVVAFGLRISQCNVGRARANFEHSDAIVQLGAGVRGEDLFPHRLFGLYGDFDHNDMVDAKDLSQYGDYWLGLK